MDNTKDALKFLEDIKPTEGVVVINHADLDGMTSCALLLRYLRSKGIEPYIMAQPMPPSKDLIKRIQTGFPNKIIFVDLAIDQQDMLLKKLKGIADILIIDHHIISHDMNKEGMIHFNPRFKDPKIYQSGAYLTYKLLSKLMDISDMLWVAMLGAVGDYDLSCSQDLVGEATKKYEMTMFHRLAAVVDSARITKFMSCEQISETLEKTKDPAQILESRDFSNAFNKIEEEIQGTVSRAETEAERVGDLIFVQIKSPFNIKSPVSTKLSEKWKGKMIVVYEKMKAHVQVSARDQSKKIGANKVFRIAARGIKGASAGGHEAAAGANIPLKDWETFKKNLIEAVQKG